MPNTNPQVEQLLAAMTLEEKVALLAGADQWCTVPIPRLGIPALKMTDGPIGARGADAPSGPTSAAFPCGSALAATWNRELVERVGQALGAETRSKGAQLLLAPTVNIHRSPLAGRNFECYSEDPYLTSQMAIAYITGVQSTGAGACIKHFVCNDSEFERRSMSSDVGERPLREIYLRPFETAITAAHPWAVMSSYNRVNGVSASENAHLLRDILKGEWQFDGIVVSDWWGTYTRHVAQGGLDIEMPGPARWMGTPVLEAVQSGDLAVSVVDDKVRRILGTLVKAGLFQDPGPHAESAVDSPAQRQVARQAATEAIVLLKNQGALLPLEPAAVKSIAVIGENARWPSIMGGGSARVTPHYISAPLAALVERAGADVRVEYALGCALHRDVRLLDNAWLRSGLTVEYWANSRFAGAPVHVETTRKLELVFVGETLSYGNTPDFAVRLTGTFVVPESGTYDLSLTSIGKAQLAIDDRTVVDNAKAPAVDEGSRAYTGEMVLVAGQIYRLQVDFASEPGAFWRNLRIGCMLRTPADAIERAVALAARSDVAIVFAGLTPEWESEGFDRPDMELPGDQARLIEQVAAVNPRTIVVVNAGSPVTMNWLDRVPAVVQAWYLGQETGHAIADVLFGDVNPCGKMPTTWPKRLIDNPAYLNYPGENGRVLYGEGLYVGYRYYDKKRIEPRVPFGYGLSYTSFAYRNLTLTATGPHRVHVSVDIENTGARAGKEIVQVYVRDEHARLARPEKELKAFAKVALEPGEKQTATFLLDEQAWAYYDPSVKRWVVEEGEFSILVGSSSSDIRLDGKVQVKS